MTIAACYLSPEGVVLGADSTSTYGLASGAHYYNNAQKLFEVGEDSTLGIVAWGLGGLNSYSHRTLIALFSDDLKGKLPNTGLDVVERWIDRFWTAYTDDKAPLAPLFEECHTLAAKQPFADGTNEPEARTETEERRFAEVSQFLVAGFCVGGYLSANRKSFAYEVIFDPLRGKPNPVEIAPGWRFWGAPNMIQRLIFGCDDGIKGAIMQSGKWGGTREELDALIGRHQLSHPIVPIRDAIDFVHACIASTIKAFKFSALSQICGGPIEIAVITTDRSFRWVRHKTWDAAINEGGP